MRPLTMVGNWKMHGSLSANQAFLQELLAAPDLGKKTRAFCFMCALSLFGSGQSVIGP